MATGTKDTTLEFSVTHKVAQTQTDEGIREPTAINEVAPAPTKTTNQSSATRRVDQTLAEGENVEFSTTSGVVQTQPDNGNDEEAKFTFRMYISPYNPEIIRSYRRLRITAAVAPVTHHEARRDR